MTRTRKPPTELGMPMTPREAAGPDEHQRRWRDAGLTGQVFGRLTVLGRDGSMYGTAAWACQCSCGATVRTRTYALKSGHIRSCGCMQREHAAETLRKAITKHGHAVPGKQSPEWRTWLRMNKRCRNPADKDYLRWGGRGIRVCERWRNSFENFLADMGKKPSAKHSLDRINNDGDYEPGNCRWATNREQSRNRSNNRYITAFGETLLVVEWAERSNVKLGTIYRRLQYGWSPERAVTP